MSLRSSQAETLPQPSPARAKVAHAALKEFLLELVHRAESLSDLCLLKGVQYCIVLKWGRGGDLKRIGHRSTIWLQTIPIERMVEMLNGVEGIGK